MPTVDDFIFGNGALHERFCFTTQVLAVLVTSAPRSISIAQIQQYIARPARDIEKVCDGLHESMLIEPDAVIRGNWSLACEPSSVTLEDVFRFVISLYSGRPLRARQESGEGEQLTMGVDLLVMQATMAVNQSVYKQLRQFPLDRLRMSATARPPISKQAIREALYDNEYDFEVNPWLINGVFEKTKRRR
jgi:DNA-binding IscR family transcriptional regulator